MLPVKKIMISFIAIITLVFSYNTKDPSNSFDVLFVYTAGAKQRAGGKTAIENKIKDSVNYINASFQNSGMAQRVHAVHIEEISYTPDYNGLNDSNKFVNAINHLKGKNDGYMDNVHQLRDKYSADFVQLVVANQAYGGLGYTMQYSAFHGFEISAFSVVKQHNMKYSSVHELGHNMGINHQTGPGTYSYSNGFTDNAYRTIHGDANGYSSLINYWSSPNLYYNGHRLGDASHDAKRTILENAPILANFRSRTAKVLPFVTRFYQSILGRTGDTAGVDYWTSSLVNNTRTGADIARGFIFSQEFMNKNTDDVTFLTILYRAFFNRNPDSGGLNYWLYRLEQGLSRYSALNGFLYSQEFKNLTAIYNIKPY